MRPLLWPLGALGILLVAIWLHLGLFPVWPGPAGLMNVTIVVILAVGLFRSWALATVLAIVAGLLVGQFSIWPGPTLVAYVAMVAVTFVIIRRWVATRSTASLVSAAGAATIIYYLALAAGVGATGGDIRWPDLIRLAIVQSVVHPILLFFLWRVMTGGTFARADRLGPSF